MLAGGAALLDGDVVVGEHRFNIALTHSERLMVAVDRLLQDSGWTIKDLDGLAAPVPPALTRPGTTAVALTLTQVAA